VRAPSPELGEHNEEIYLDLLALDRARYDELRARKVI
jgi:crotonobetainyl-CoA:carnitine CoA-transferase CaiB-like acyl-CoA transferase